MRTRNLSAFVLMLCVRAVALASGPLIQFVSPGESIQAAINRAPEGGWIFMQAGTYQETADSTNGLTITRGINLAGLSTADKKVVLVNSGGQRNGIVAVPPANTNCMSCHSSMAPPRTRPIRLRLPPAISPFLRMA